jgi:hypothetical protein
VAQVIEALMGLAQRTGAVRVRTGPRDAALREARVCYDHLAGARGVELLEGLKLRGFVAGEDEPRLTGEGREFFGAFGIDIARMEKGRRPVCRHCLDWSERRNHLGGALGAAILSTMSERRWIKRTEGRVLTFLPEGHRRFRATFVHGAVA